MITSSANKTVLLDCRLKDKKERDERGEFLLEGAKLIEEAKKAGYKIVRVYAKDEKRLPFLTTDAIELATENVIAKLSDVKTPQGEVAVVKKSSKNLTNAKNRALVLENLQDPKNVGSLIRTAAATDFTDVIAINCADPFSMKAIRSSMGGIFKVNVIESSLEGLKCSLVGKTLYVADMDGKNVFQETFPKENVAIAVGNEGNGVSEEIKCLADEIVSIPMANDVESLNVAVSGGVLMYRFQ